MKHIFISMAAMLMLLILSCEYDTKEIYKRDLNQNTKPPDIEVIQLDLTEEKDTIELLYNRVYFNFKSSDQHIRGVKFYLNDSAIGYAESGNSYFDMNVQNLYNGTHRLKLELFTQSGTGSIADSLGMEGFLFTTKEWVIKVNSTTYSEVTSTVKDGFLMLRWTKPHDGIPEYLIYRENSKIGESTTCEFIDKGYVGEGAEYTVKYRNSFNEEQITVGMVRIPNEMKLNFVYDSDNNYQISWGKLKYYAAIDSVIVFSNDRHYGSYEIHKTTDINRSGFEISKSYFSQYRSFRMVLTPKYYNPLYSRLTSPYDYFSSRYFEFEIGASSPIFRNFMSVNSSEFIYHTNMYDHENIVRHDSIYRYSALQNKVVERCGINRQSPFETSDDFWNPAASSNGNYFTSFYKVYNTKAIISSGNDLKNYKIMDLSSIGSKFGQKIPISDNGIGILYGSDKRILYDFKNDSILGYLDGATWADDYNISSNGKYFFFQISSTIWLYSYLNNKIALEKTIYNWSTTGYDYFRFMSNDPEKAVSWNKSSKVFSILRTSDMQVLKSFQVNENALWDIDFYNNQILSFSPKHLVVRSLTGGTVLYDIPVNFTNVIFNQCYLCGNSIFHQEGARYFLN